MRRQILFNAALGRHDAGQEHLGESRLLPEHVDQGVLFQPDQRAFGDGGGGDQAVLGVGQAAFAEKISGPRMPSTACLPSLETAAMLVLPLWMK